jgi:hypothetical protein
MKGHAVLLSMAVLGAMPTIMAERKIRQVRTLFVALPQISGK